MFRPNTFTPRIAIFYDGNFLLHTSNYYNYIHPIRKRISINGLHRFIKHQVADRYGVSTDQCHIVGAHYFRGRLSASEASARSNQLYNDRVFDDILMAEGISTHYLPLRNFGARREERGTDVWLALEAFEMASRSMMDIAVLLISDTDYIPLLRKLAALDIRSMVMAWDFEYVSDEGVRMVTKTSYELISMADYPMVMHDVIDRGLETGESLIENIFVSNATTSFTDQISTSESFNSPHLQITYSKSERLEGEILSVKNGYGFIKYPNNNLFFHNVDIVDGDFWKLAPGDQVEFTISRNDTGQEVAREVKIMKF